MKIVYRQARREGKDLKIEDRRESQQTTNVIPNRRGAAVRNLLLTKELTGEIRAKPSRVLSGK